MIKIFIIYLYIYLSRIFTNKYTFHIDILQMQFIVINNKILPNMYTHIFHKTPEKYLAQKKTIHLSPLVTVNIVT